MYERLRTVIIENLDWQACFDRYNRPGALIYIDPPYPENGCNYVYNMRETKEHELLASKLQQAQCKWVVSSYDTDFVRQLFANYTIVPLESKSGMNTEKNGNTRVTNKEVIILNYPLPTVLDVEPTPKVRNIRKSLKPEIIQQNTLLDEVASSE